MVIIIHCNLYADGSHKSRRRALLRLPRQSRYRLVADTLAANIGVTEEPLVRFQTVTHVKSQLATCEWAASIDLKSFYYQFQLGEKVRRFFTFKVRDRFFQLFTPADGIQDGSADRTALR